MIFNNEQELKEFSDSIIEKMKQIINDYENSEEKNIFSMTYEIVESLKSTTIADILDGCFPEETIVSIEVYDYGNTDDLVRRFPDTTINDIFKNKEFEKVLKATQFAWHIIDDSIYFDVAGTKDDV